MGSQSKIKLIVDTNVLISAFLWQGRTAEILDLVEEEKVLIFLNQNLIEEFKRTLEYTKFHTRLTKLGLTPEKIIKSLIRSRKFCLTDNYLI